jgi:hypothetical protein
VAASSVTLFVHSVTLRAGPARLRFLLRES